MIKCFFSGTGLEGVAVHGTAIPNLGLDVKAGASKYYRSRARYSPHHKKDEPSSGGVGFGSSAPRFDTGEAFFRMVCKHLLAFISKAYSNYQ